MKAKLTHGFEKMANCIVSFYYYRKKETPAPPNKLPAVPESVLKKRKRREQVKAARLQISLKVIVTYIMFYTNNFIF